MCLLLCLKILWSILCFFIVRIRTYLFRNRAGGSQGYNEEEFKGHKKRRKSLEQNERREEEGRENRSKLNLTTKEVTPVCKKKGRNQRRSQFNASKERRGKEKREREREKRRRFLDEREGDLRENVSNKNPCHRHFGLQNDWALPVKTTTLIWLLPFLSLSFPSSDPFFTSLPSFCIWVKVDQRISNSLRFARKVLKRIFRGKRRRRTDTLFVMENTFPSGFSYTGRYRMKEHRLQRRDEEGIFGTLYFFVYNVSVCLFFDLSSFHFFFFSRESCSVSRMFRCLVLFFAYMFWTMFCTFHFLPVFFPL